MPLSYTTILSENFKFLVLLSRKNKQKTEAVIHFSHHPTLLPNDFLRIFVKVKMVRFQGPPEPTNNALLYVRLSSLQDNLLANLQFF